MQQSLPLQHCEFEDLIFGESCCTYDEIVYEGFPGDDWSKTVHFMNPTNLTKISFCLMEKPEITIVPNFTLLTTVVFEDEQYTTSGNEHCVARTGKTAFKINTTSEFGVVIKLAEAVTLNFEDVHHQYIFVDARKSRVPVSLTGAQSPGFWFSGFINDSVIEMSGVDFVDNISFICGSSKYQRNFIIDENEMGGEECWCRPVVDGGTVKSWNSPDCLYQSQHLSLAVEESMTFDTKQLGQWNKIVFNNTATIKPVFFDEHFVTTEIVIASPISNLNKEPLINAVGVQRLFSDSVNVTAEQESCVEIAAFQSIFESLGFTPEVPDSWKLLRLDRLVRLCPTSKEDNVVNCSVASATWDDALSEFTPQCPCKRGFDWFCMIIVRTPILDWQQVSGHSVILESNTTFSNTSGFDSLDLNGFSTRFASGMPVVDYLYGDGTVVVATETTIDIIDGGERLTLIVHEALTLLRPFHINTIEMDAATPINISQVDYFTVNTLTIRQSTPNSLTVFSPSSQVGGMVRIGTCVINATPGSVVLGEWVLEIETLRGSGQITLPTKTTIYKIENGTTIAISAPLTIVSDSEIKRLEITTDVSVSISWASSISVGEVVVEKEREKSKPIFTPNVICEQITLHVGKAMRTGGENANILLALQKEWRVDGADACDGQALVANANMTEKDMCTELSLWDRLCQFNQNGTYTDTHLGMRDITCPCNREHSHCTIVFEDGVREYTVSTNVNEFVIQHTMMLNTSDRLFALQRANSDAPQKGGNVIITVNGTGNVILATSMSKGMVIQSSSEGGHTVLVARDTLLSFVGGAVRVEPDTSPLATTLGCHVPTDSQPSTLLVRRLWSAITLS